MNHLFYLLISFKHIYQQCRPETSFRMERDPIMAPPLLAPNIGARVFGAPGKALSLMVIHILATRSQSKHRKAKKIFFFLYSLPLRRSLELGAWSGRSIRPMVGPALSINIKDPCIFVFI